MKTLNQSLVDEFEQILKEFDFSIGNGQVVDKNKLKKIYIELLKHKDNNEDFEKSARTVVNTVLNNEFKS